MRSLEKRVAFSSGIGSILEMYDFSLYAFFAPILGELFFPAPTKISSLLTAFSVFAVGYLMRPFGAALFGNFGDKFGRKKILVLSVLLMGIPTGLIGCLPTFNQAGLWAPSLLVFIRLVQGLAVGSEFAGATIFMAEHANPKRRGFMCSWVVFGIQVGLLVGSGIGAITTLFFSHNTLLAWGWRIPFLLGLIIIPIAFYIRRNVPESPVFIEMEKQRKLLKTPVLYLLRHHWRQMIQASGIIWICAAAVGLLFVYMSSHLSVVLHFSLSQSLRINSCNTFLLIVLIPFMGALSDRYGRKPLLFIGTLGLILTAYPLFLWLQITKSLLSIYFIQSIFALFSSCILGTFGSTVVELFPGKVRYSGVSIAYNVMSGTGPLLATVLVWITKNPASPSFYLIFSGLISLLFVIFIKESSKISLRF